MEGGLTKFIEYTGGAFAIMVVAMPIQDQAQGKRGGRGGGEVERRLWSQSTRREWLF